MIPNDTRSNDGALLTSRKVIGVNQIEFAWRRLFLQEERRSTSKKSEDAPIIAKKLRVTVLLDKHVSNAMMCM